MNPFLESTELLDHPEQLKTRAHAEGYLFFRGLIDTDAVFQVRRDFAEILSAHGWLDADTEPMDAISSQPSRREGMPEYWPVLDAFQRLESFHSFAHQPTLLKALETLFGEPVLVHPRNIGRIIFPTAIEHTTPPHQDFVHIQGTPDVWTAWIPLGDCPRSLGGLAVLPTSHRQGTLPVHRTLGAGGVGVDTSDQDDNWVSSEFKTGDVLLFHSLTVHKGLENQSGNCIRLSVDYRYQGISQPVTEGSLLPHFNRLTWEQIYQDWKSTTYQYYWKKWNLKMVPFDPGVYRLDG